MLLSSNSNSNSKMCRFRRVAIKVVDKKLVQLQLDQAQAAAAEKTDSSSGAAASLAAAAAAGTGIKEIHMMLYRVPETPLAEVFFAPCFQGLPHVHSLLEVSISVLVVVAATVHADSPAPYGSFASRSRV